MSKEITPKGALDELCDLATPNGDCLNYGIGLSGIILKALDRLEVLEKIFSGSHTCEIKARFNEIECSADKCDNCPLSIGDDICLKKTFEKKWELQKENQDLKNKNAALKIKVKAWEKHGEKLKKVIDILKEKANIRLHILTNADGSKIYEIEFIFTYYSTIHEITQQEYDLLKELLENGGN